MSIKEVVQLKIRSLVVFHSDFIDRIWQETIVFNPVKRVFKTTIHNYFENVPNFTRQRPYMLMWISTDLQILNHNIKPTCIRFSKVCFWKRKDSEPDKTGNMIKIRKLHLGNVGHSQAWVFLFRGRMVILRLGPCHHLGFRRPA